MLNQFASGVRRRLRRAFRPEWRSGATEGRRWRPGNSWDATHCARSVV